MAKILYGVMGNTYGHVMRTQAIVERLMPEHEFAFVGGGHVPGTLGKRGWNVLEVPVLRTVHRGGKVSVSAVVGQIIGRMTETPRVVGQIDRLMDRFQPDLAICDREFFPAHRLPPRRTALPLAGPFARAQGVPLPGAAGRAAELGAGDAQRLPALRFHAAPSHRQFFSSAAAPKRRRRRGDVDELLPPVLRPAVTRMKSSPGDHVLVYQTSATFRPLLEPARAARPTRHCLRLRHREPNTGAATSRSSRTTTGASSKTSPGAPTRWSTAGTT